MGLQWPPPCLQSLPVKVLKRSKEKRIVRTDNAFSAGDDCFRLAVEAAANGMVILDQEGHILLVNSPAERLFGYARSELIGRSIDILVAESSRSSHDSYVQEFFTNPQAKAMGLRELGARRKDGTEFTMEIGLNRIQTEQW